MGLPNWTLSLAYLSDSSRQLRWLPRVQPERVILSVHRPLVRTATPLFNPPISCSAGISTSSKVIRAVGDVLIPHFLIFSLVTPLTFLNSKQNAEIPFGPAAGSVFA